jgi:hypothetical protein
MDSATTSKAYSVINVVEAEGVSLICCRNPWATGEWTGRYSDKNAHGEWTPALKKACNWTDEDDGMFWIEAKDFVKNVRNVNYARSFGVAWRKVTQWHHFSDTKLTATATKDYQQNKANMLKFKKGEKLTITDLDPQRTFKKGVNAAGKEGFIYDTHLTLDTTGQACAKYDLKSDHTAGKVRAVILLTQKNRNLQKTYHWDTSKKDNVKDSVYCDRF